MRTEDFVRELEKVAYKVVEIMDEIEDEADK